MGRRRIWRPIADDAYSAVYTPRQRLVTVLRDRGNTTDAARLMVDGHTVARDIAWDGTSEGAEKIVQRYRQTIETTFTSSE